MPRPRKALPPQSPSDPNQVVDYIAKAKALVAKAGSQKRKSDDDDGAKATPATKPKSCVVTAPATEAPKAIPAKVVAAPPPPTRVRGKSPANEAAAVSVAKPMPAVVTPTAPPAKATGVPALPVPCPGPKVCPPPPKADSPGGSSSSSASDRTREVLLKAKAAKLAAQGKATPAPKVTPVPKPAVPKACSAETSPTEPRDVYATPPPKQNTFASPKSTTPVAPMKKLDSYESDDFCCSQRDYYGRKGQSWWGNHSGWDRYPYHNWYYDHSKSRYVFTHGPESWVWDGPWEKNWWENNHEDAGESPTNTPDATNDDRTRDDAIWHALTERRPSTIATSPGEEVPMTPGSDVIMAFPPDDERQDVTEPPDATSLETPDAHAAENNEVHAAENNEVHAAEPSVPEELIAAETPTAPEVDSHGDRAKEAPAAGEDNKWRCDKHGKLLNPEALYMRFFTVAFEVTWLHETTQHFAQS